MILLNKSTLLRACVPVHFAAALAVLTLSCCVSTPETSKWRTVNYISFTIDLPTWLRHKPIQAICGGADSYTSRRMFVDLSMGSSILYPIKDAQAGHDELQRKYRNTPQDESSREFIRRVGDRYVLIKVSEDRTRAKGRYVGKYGVKVFSPNPEGGYLSLFIAYRDPAYTSTALRMAKSLQFKNR